MVSKARHRPQILQLHRQSHRAFRSGVRGKKLTMCFILNNGLNRTTSSQSHGVESKASTPNITTASSIAQGFQIGSTGEEINDVLYFEQRVESHHIFPVSWCRKQGIDPKYYNCVVNRTGLSDREYGGRN